MLNLLLKEPSSMTLQHLNIFIEKVSGSSHMQLQHILKCICDTILIFYPSKQSKISKNVIACVLLPLFNGSVPDKIIKLFQFISSESTLIALNQLKDILFAPLILCLAFNRNDLSNQQLFNIVDIKYMSIYKSIKQILNLDSDYININQFLEWYRINSLLYTPWMELYDLNSFPAVDSSDEESDISKDRLVFSFEISQDCHIELTKEKLDYIYTFSEDSGLNLLSIETIFDILKSRSENGYLNLPDFKDLLKSKKVWMLAEDHIKLLEQLFIVYDRYNTGYVNIEDLVCGFSFFLKGTKSEKLQVLFGLFDENSDENVTFNGFKRYLLSIISFFKLLQDVTTTELEDYCASISNQIFKMINNGHLNISFNKFASWYNDNGFKLLNWLELLDLSKWNLKKLMERVEEKSDKEEIIIDNIKIDKSSIKTFDLIMEDTLLPSMQSDKLILDLLSRSNGGLITYTDYMNVILSLLKTSDDRVSEVFVEIFEIFESSVENYVDALEIISSLILFTSGSKSDKLYAMFHYFDKDGNNTLSYNRLQTFLESFLTILNYLTNSNLDKHIHSTVMKIISLFSDYTGLKSEQFFDLDVFGEWYNNGGSEICPWLELLSTTKWPLYEESQQSDEESDTKYIFPLNNQNESIIITERDGIKIRMCYESMPWCNLSDLFKLFSKDKIYKSELRQKFPIQSHGIFLSLFDHLDLNRNTYVDKNMMLTSLSLLIPVNKTEKLNTCFNLFCQNDRISYRNLFSFLFSILWSIHFYQHQSNSYHSISKHIEDITEAIFEYCGTDEKLTFIEFAEWYNKLGYRDASWLELLDIYKWPNMDILPVKQLEVPKEPQIENKPMYSFTLNENGDSLIVTTEDVDVLEQILKFTKFYVYTPTDIIMSILELSDTSLISLDSFMSYILSITNCLGQENQQYIQNEFENIFYNLENNENGYANKNCLASAMTIFVGGDKSQKLYSAFELFQDEKTGLLSRENARLFFLSFLVGLLSCSSQYLNISLDKFHSVTESTVSLILHSLFTSNFVKDNSVTFTEFATWYGKFGYHIIPWIELYALNKWPFGLLTDSVETPVDDNSLDFTLNEGTDAEDKLMVKITQNDIRCVRYFVKNCELINYSVDNVIEAFDYYSDLDTLNFDQFVEILSFLITKSTLTRMKPIFKKLFTFVDTKKSGYVLKMYLQIILITLTKEKKSPKLNKAFELIAGSLDNSVPSQILVRFFVVLLTPIVFLLENPPNFADLVEYSQKMINQLTKDMKIEKFISFDDFSDWYSSEGFKILNR